MQQKDLVVGFSDLKDILIQTYKIEKPRDQIRLYFSFVGTELRMHDYEDHEKAVTVISDAGDIQPKPGSFGWRLINFAKKVKTPRFYSMNFFNYTAFFGFN